MTDPALFYLSAEEYREQTTAPTLVSSLSDSAVKPHLLRCMVEIDAYIGEGWTPYTDGQEFVFPRSRDENSAGEPEIPRAVSLATCMIADAILQQRNMGVLPHEVASESNLGHSFTKHTKRVETEKGFEHWPPQVFALLDPLRLNGGFLAVPDPALQE